MRISKTITFELRRPETRNCVTQSGPKAIFSPVYRLEDMLQQTSPLQQHFGSLKVGELLRPTLGLFQFYTQDYKIQATTIVQFSQSHEYCCSIHFDSDDRYL